MTKRNNCFAYVRFMNKRDKAQVKKTSCERGRLTLKCTHEEAFAKSTKRMNTHNETVVNFSGLEVIVRKVSTEFYLPLFGIHPANLGTLYVIFELYVHGETLC